MYDDSKDRSKYDERPSRGEKSYKGKGSLSHRRTISPAKKERPKATREHKRKDYCEPEPPQCDSDDSFTGHKRDVSCSTHTVYRIPRPSPMGDRVLDSGPSSGRAGYYEPGGLYPPLDTGLKDYTRRGSRQDDYYVPTPHGRYDRFSAPHGQYGNQVPVRYPESGYVPARPDGYDYVPPPMIEGSDRHRRLLKAPGDNGSRRGHH